MSVINGKSDTYHDSGRTCSFCAEELRYPYVGWDTPNRMQDILICSACCVKVKGGLIADLVQVAACHEIKQFYKYQPGDKTVCFKREYTEGGPPRRVNPVEGLFWDDKVSKIHPTPAPWKAENK